MMIISQLIGGLGNQMFQYAVGRSLASRCDIPFKIDVSDFSNYGRHQGFELQRVFSCPVEIASQADVKQQLGWQQSSSVRRLLKQKPLHLLRKKNHIVEPHFHYWSGIRDLTGNKYLSGYWQSEKYFQDIQSIIRKDFTFKVPLDSRNERIAEKIQDVNSVSIHVRRGDYISNPVTFSTHGTCSKSYFEKAIHHISTQIENPHFYFFSDDIAWVKESIDIDFPCDYICHNQGKESFNDMRLMSLCKNNIIANSSFSWWGAWLNKNPTKIVLAPSRWFNISENTTDLLPATWVTL